MEPQLDLGLGVAYLGVGAIAATLAILGAPFPESDAAGNSRIEDHPNAVPILWVIAAVSPVLSAAHWIAYPIGRNQVAKCEAAYESWEAAGSPNPTPIPPRPPPPAPPPSSLELVHNGTWEAIFTVSTSTSGHEGDWAEAVAPTRLKPRSRIEIPSVFGQPKGTPLFVLVHVLSLGQDYVHRAEGVVVRGSVLVIELYFDEAYGEHRLRSEWR